MWITEAEWRELIPPGEEAILRAYGEEIRVAQAERALKRGRAERALHVKPHVGVRAELVVGSVPEGLRVGPFAEPGRFSAFVRFSNGSGFAQSDRRPDLRGVAIKVVGVTGRKVIAGLEDKVTQDFLLIPTASLATGTPAEFMDLFRAGKAGPALVLPRLFWFAGFRRAVSLLKRFAGMPKVGEVAQTRFHTGAPLRFGDYAAKLDLLPVDPGPAPDSAPTGPGEVREALIARLSAGPIVYALRAQLFLDEATTPIEDASVTWPEDKTPFIEVARLVIPRQDVGSAEGAAVESFVETLSFDPWHAVEALKPLGAIMRARAHAYRESVIGRGAAPEPDGTESG